MLCRTQLGELEKKLTLFRDRAEVLVINPDAPEESRQLRQATRISGPLLLDRQLKVVRQYDMEVKPGQPMGGMQGFPQMGYVIVDGSGRIRAQRVDLEFGKHADQILDLLERL